MPKGTEEKVLAEELEAATKPSIVNVPLTSANIQYKHKLPIGCKRFQIQLRTADDFLLAVVDDVVSAATPKEPRYFTVKSGTVLAADDLDIDRDIWLYFMNSAGSVVVEILQWT